MTVDGSSHRAYIWLQGGISAITSWWPFILREPPLIQKTPPPQILSDPVFDIPLELFKITLTFFRLDVPTLEILKIEDIAGMSNKISLRLASRSKFVD